jgi:hypothetical protein
MTGPTTPPGIEVTFTVTLTMTPGQIAAYAREYGIDAEPAFPRVSGDVVARLRDDAAAVLETEYWISSFTTVRVSPLRLASWLPMLAAARRRR